MFNASRWRYFKQNKRAYVSLWVFGVLFLLSLLAELIANDKPLLIKYQHHFYSPLVHTYVEKDFGGELGVVADYKDPHLVGLINKDGWMLWPPIRFSYNTHNYHVQHAPSPPTSQNLLGTDDHARDVLARLIYGFRLSIVFGLCLTVFSSVIGVIAGVLQGYFGGKLDLFFQRFMEIWSGLPSLYILIIIASLVVSGFWVLLAILTLFSWMSLVAVVRAETLRTRQFDFIKAAMALGVSNRQIMWRHILPNAMVATFTFIPFILNGSIVTLVSLDFLGFGLPPGTASFGDLIAQAKDNLHAYWIAISVFVTAVMQLSLIVFIGEGLRDAFDPRKTIA